MHPKTIPTLLYLSLLQASTGAAAPGPSPLTRVTLLSTLIPDAPFRLVNGHPYTKSTSALLFQTETSSYRYDFVRGGGDLFRFDSASPVILRRLNLSNTTPPPVGNARPIIIDASTTLAASSTIEVPYGSISGLTPTAIESSFIAKLAQAPRYAPGCAGVVGRAYGGSNDFMHDWLHDFDLEPAPAPSTTALQRSMLSLAVFFDRNEICPAKRPRLISALVAQQADDPANVELRWRNPALPPVAPAALAAFKDAAVRTRRTGFDEFPDYGVKYKHGAPFSDYQTGLFDDTDSDDDDDDFEVGGQEVEVHEDEMNSDQEELNLATCPFRCILE
ncbi:MAG: hypothetical protein M1825_001854 [Sarcosagium campestre]|nr:MAG: hypothetical protein M1825_001854 [Sarcosagium campestre]